jgi:hypothetical protein
LVEVVPKETRFEKLSFAGVEGFDEGWLDGALNGDALPEAGGVGFNVLKAE